jgi:hypothetical protein
VRTAPTENDWVCDETAADIVEIVFTERLLRA